MTVSARVALFAFIAMFGLTALDDSETLGMMMSPTLMAGSAFIDGYNDQLDRALLDQIRDHQKVLALSQPERLSPPPTDQIDSETLWLARAIYSETKRPYEQELVAWVLRNRVETRYRGKGTYRDVVLDPWQFSAFNPGPKRRHYSGLTPTSRAAGWQTAIGIAHAVRNADEDLRPFSHNTRHFYSEISMVGRRHPSWARGKQPVTPERPVQINPKRFRFFDNVS
jgi:hypothetical protein